MYELASPAVLLEAIDFRRNRSGGSNQGSSPTPRKLCVGVGDAEAVTVAKLKDMFGAFGEVMRVDTPKGKSYSFVEFAERTAAARALAALNNQPLFGRHCRSERE